MAKTPENRSVRERGSGARLPLTVFNWLDRLPDPVRDALLARCRDIVLQQGEFLWSRGDRNYDLYQLVDGELDLYSLTLEGKKLLYFTFTSGDCTGENGMIDGEPRYHMAQAVNTTRLRHLTCADYVELSSLYPELNRELLKMMSRRSRILYEYMDAMTLLPMSVRIASRLCLLLDKELAGSHASGEVDLQVTQEDIGDMLATTRQSVSRILADWQCRGIVNMRYGRIVVIDPAALRKEKLGQL
jgi:CRP-like cAMP-binding protein